MPMRFLVFSLALGISVSAAAGQEKRPALPIWEPPQIVLATAKEKEGEVVLRLVSHHRREFSEEINGQVQTYAAIVTSEGEVNLEDASLTTKAGKPLDKADVLKRLSKETKVVLFRNEPDPYYLDVFRDDIVVITAGVRWKEGAKKRIAD